MTNRNTLIELASKVKEEAPVTEKKLIAGYEYTEEDVKKEAELIRELSLVTAKDGKWSYEYDFSKINKPIDKTYVVAVSVELKSIMSDVMVIVDTGKLSITTSWFKSNEV